MEIQKILNYQAKDAEIFELEKELKKYKESEVLDKIKNAVRQSQNSSSSLEEEAETSLKEYNKFNKEFENAVKKLNEYSSVDIKSLSDEECKAKLKKVNDISNLLGSLEKKILSLADKINLILTEFEKAKTQYKKARAQHLKYKEQYQKVADQIAPKIDALKQELSEMEKNLESKFLNKYKKIRQEIFPVLVPLQNNVCGRCGMELPSAQLEKLQDEGFLQCENCHRIIYFNE